MIAQSVFSVWDVPDTSDAAALFFHDLTPSLTPAPADETPISESPVEEDEVNSLECHQLPILPISLIPEEGSDIHLSPLPVLTAPVEDVTVQQNKVRLFVFVCEFYVMNNWLRISGSG